MQRFYFNVRVGPSISEDREGEILPDLATAVIEAVRIARDHVRDELHRGKPLSLDGSVDVLLAPGDIPARVTFADAVGRSLG